MLIGKIFGDPEFTGGNTLTDNGISPWISLIAVLAIAGLAGALLYRRYRRIM